MGGWRRLNDDDPVDAHGFCLLTHSLPTALILRGCIKLVQWILVHLAAITTVSVVVDRALHGRHIVARVVAYKAIVSPFLSLCLLHLLERHGRLRLRVQVLQVERTVMLWP